ncbi:hypothetical protein BIWAKO_04262 [Bosea sp. BIWAKO-01]|nr:hypothetical protein BIWAKO_04262 [Bosea sp. BIWAKO-01]
MTQAEGSATHVHAWEQATRVPGSAAGTWLKQTAAKQPPGRGPRELSG